MTYLEKLRDPRWQKRRLEIMQRADFACEKCGARDKTLNVHHKFYVKGREPWEYADDELGCLCEECHSELHQLRDAITRLSADFGTAEAAQLAGYAAGLLLFKKPDERIAHGNDRFFLIGVGASFGMTLEQVRAVVVGEWVSGHALLGVVGNPLGTPT